jgi:hypothetical protein
MTVIIKHHGKHAEQNYLRSLQHDKYCLETMQTHTHDYLRLMTLLLIKIILKIIHLFFNILTITYSFSCFLEMGI